MKIYMLLCVSVHKIAIDAVQYMKVFFSICCRLPLLDGMLWLWLSVFICRIQFIFKRILLLFQFSKQFSPSANGSASKKTREHHKITCTQIPTSKYVRLRLSTFFCYMPYFLFVFRFIFTYFLLLQLQSNKADENINYFLSQNNYERSKSDARIGILNIQFGRKLSLKAFEKLC